jgi:hypothetical protein
MTRLQSPFNNPFASPARSPLNDNDGLFPFLTPEELQVQTRKKSVKSVKSVK